MSTPQQQEMEQEMGRATNPSLPSSSPPPRQPLPATILLLLLNISFMLLGIGAPLLLRLYFIHGGSRLWLTTFLQSAGFPILLVPILVNSFLNKRRPFQLPLGVLIASPVLGVLYGLDGYLYAYGSSYLPVSTSSILFSSQLSFTAVFAFFISRQRFTAYSINAVVLLTIGPVVLGLSSSKDRPAGLSNAKYYLGFAMSLAAALLLGLLLPVMERMYKSVKEGVSFAMVLEIQFLLLVFATGFALVGMVANRDFQAIAREAREFDIGATKYFVVIIADAVLFQLAVLGLMGTIACSSSLFGGILNAVILPLSEIFAVIFFHEKFDGNKGIALTLCMWGFVSYLYGERRQSRKTKKAEVEIPPIEP